MPTDVSRLDEARKQIRLVAENREELDLVEDLEEAEAILEAVEVALADE